jgi:16S rRNA (uracil1498-N3)-methyltransferase
VFVADVDHPVLEDLDRHHLHRALRLRPGDALVVTDGAGSWRPARFGDEVEPVGSVTLVARPAPQLTVGLTPTKGDRPEWAVQKLTELSVDRIVVLRTERSVVRWEGDRADHHLERLRRVSREAAMQSRQVWLPEVLGVHTLEDHPGAVLADPGGRPPAVGDTTVLCGPEGGWSDAERASGRDRVALGGAVLRAETAAVTAGALLSALRHGLVRPA